MMDRALRSGKLSYFGNEVLTYKIEIPIIDGCDEINFFYSSIADECEKYCRGTLFQEQCQAESRSKGVYKLICRVTHKDEDLVCVLMRACFSKNRKIYRDFLRAHTWELKSACMLPPWMLCERISSAKRMNRREAEGAFLMNGDLFVLKDVNIEEILC